MFHYFRRCTRRSRRLVDRIVMHTQVDVAAADALEQRSVIPWCAKDWSDGVAVSGTGESTDVVGRRCVWMGGAVGAWRGAGMVAVGGALLTGFAISTSEMSAGPWPLLFEWNHCTYLLALDVDAGTGARCLFHVLEL